MRVFLAAGEPSGDRLGAALMAGLRVLVPEVEFAGVGGPAMAAEGLISLFPMEELAVMGLIEVLPKYRHLLRRINETAEAALRWQPDVVVTVDSPDFGLRVAARVKAQRPDLLTVHYVAPSVWAWRPGRAVKMARVIDHVLAILPFEPPYMQAAGMTCDFVGHPVVAEPQASPEEAAAFRDRIGPYLLVLPGSRRGEVARLAPIFREVIGQLSVPAVIPTVRGTAALVRDLLGDVARVLDPDDPDRRAAFRGAEAALAASGTVSLELAAAGTPMVIAYRFQWLSWQIMKRMIRIDTATLVNLVSDTRAVPEFIGEQCRAELIAPAVARVMQGDPAQQAAMRVTMERLGQGGEPPSLRAARSVLARCQPRQIQPPPSTRLPPVS